MRKLSTPIVLLALLLALTFLFSYKNAQAQNIVPTITSIGTKQTCQNTTSATIPFTVTDANGNNVTVTATNNNIALVPLANIKYNNNTSTTSTGAPGLRNVTITPAAGQTGKAIITLIPNDGIANGPAINFTLTVGEVNKQFTAGTWGGFSANSSYPVFADMDGDGDLDGFVGTKHEGVFYYKNTGGVFTQLFLNDNPLVNAWGDYLSPCFGDLDGDGDLDAFVGDFNGNIRYYKNMGGWFAEMQNVNNPLFNVGTSVSGGSAHPFLVDTDGDGDLDLCVGNGNGTIKYYKRVSTAPDGFEVLTGAANPFNGVDVGDWSTPSFADIDMDGDMDAFIGSSDGDITYLKNTNGVFTADISPLNTTSTLSTPSFADIDYDGDADAFIGSWYVFNHGMQYFENTSTIGTCNTSAPTITAIASKISCQNSTTTAIPFTVADVEGNDITVIASSSNPSLVPVANIKYNNNSSTSSTGIPGLRNVSITPTGQTGISIITLTPNDALHVGTPTSFVMTVGNISFGSFTSITGSANPFATSIGIMAMPVFADVDGDADQDVFVGVGDGTIKYYRNTGTVFTQQTGSANPFNGIDVGGNAIPRFADVDGDGDVDAFIGANDGTIKYYRNTGGVYTVQTGSANPLNLVSVGTYANPGFVDLDGDGDLDVFVGLENGTINYYQNSSGVFTAQAGITNPFNGIDIGDYAAPSFADIDGDGDADAFIGEGGTGTVKYYQRSGVTFTPKTGTDNPLNAISGNVFSAPTFGDIDNDGDLDALISAFDGFIKYYKNTSTIEACNFPPTITAIGAQRTCQNVATGAIPFTIADGNGDNITVIVSSSNTTVVPLGNIKFNNNTSLTSSGGAGLRNVTITPATGKIGTSIISLTPNDGISSGAPSFFTLTVGAARMVLSSQSGINNPLNGIDVGAYSTPSFFDVDGDGNLDAILGEENGTIKYYKNMSGVSFSLVTGSANPFNGVDVGLGSACSFADIDNDGDQDAFIGEFDGNINYFRNTGGVFTEITGSINPFNGVDVGSASSIAFGDLDSDGDLDALIGEVVGNINYYRNNGGIFVEQLSSANPFDGVNLGGYSTPSFADRDGDGDQDVIIGQINGIVYYYENMGDGVFTEQTGSANPLNGVFGGMAATPCFVDIDSDGDLDAFVGNDVGTINYYRNTPAVGVCKYNPTITAISPIRICQNSTSITIPFTVADGNNDNITVTAYSSNPAVVPLNNIKYNNNSTTSSTGAPGIRNVTISTTAQTGTSTITLIPNDGSANGKATTFVVTVGKMSLGSFTEQTGSANPFNGMSFGTYAKPCLADVDSDGDPDFVIGLSDGTIKYFKNTAGIYTEKQFIDNPFNGIDVGNDCFPVFVDLEGDGDLDAFFANSGGFMKYYQNNGGVFTEVTGNANPFNGMSLGVSATPVFVDIDTDGDQDLFVGINFDGTIKYYQNTGGVYTVITGSANPLDGVHLGPSFWPAPCFNDIDGDGDLDAFVGYRYGINYYQNTAGAFNQQTGTSNPLNAASVGYIATPSFADVDNDGDLDVLIGDGVGPLKYYKNTSTIGVCNNAPAITPVSAQVICQNTVTATLPFSVTDDNGNSITVTATSSNTALVPIANIKYNNNTDLTSTGTLSLRNVTITPVIGQSGTTTITLTPNNGSLNGTSTIFTLTVLPTGNPTIFGNNVWNVYAFNIGGANSTPGTTWVNNYVGYYPNPNLNFNTQDHWAESSSPSSAAGYIGCATVTDDNHSWTAKRQGFPCGYYQLNILNHDDESQLLVNGVLVSTLTGFSSSPTNNVWRGHLDANSTIEFRCTDGVGGSLGSLELVPYSSTSIGITLPFGTNTWNVYAFNTGGSSSTLGATWISNYAGYYTNSNLNFNTQDSWDQFLSPSSATGYQGCTVTNDNHSWTAKRRGFTPGNYQINILNHDDETQLLVNGNLVSTLSGFTTNATNNVWSGYLDTNSTIEFRCTDGIGGSHGSLEIAAFAAEINVQGNNTNIPDGAITTSAGNNTDFGSTLLNTPLVKIFTIQNTGNAILNVNSISVTGTNASEFQVSGVPTTVGIGSSANFTITFTPTAIGTRTSTIHVNSDDVDESDYDFVIIGTGITPEIHVMANGNVITDNSNTVSLLNHTDFGNIPQNTSFARTFTIQNMGSSVLNISSISVTGTNASEFQVSGAPATVGIGSSANFTITFMPTALGIRTSTIHINNNDADEADYDFAIQGTGTAPAASLHFDGSNDYTSINNTTLGNFGTGDFTLEMDIKTSSDNVYLLSKRGFCGATNFVSLGIGAGKINAEIHDGSTHLVLNGTTIINDNNWHHIAITRSASTVRIYADGVLNNTGTHNGNVDNGSAFEIAHSPCTNTNYFAGNIDELRIWNVARSITEINQYKGCEIATTQPGLQANYHFNQGLAGANNASTNTLVDGVGTNTGTLTNFALSGTSSNWHQFGAVTTGSICSFPEINIVSNANNIMDGSATPFTTNNTDFGSTLLNMPVAKTFTIENIGDAVLNISSISITGTNASEFVVNGVPTIVAVGASANFTVTFTPTILGLRTARIHVNNDDYDEPDYDFAIAGTGIAPANILPIANNDTYSTAEDNSLIVTVPGVVTNDTDADNNTLTAILQSGPANGTLTFNTNGSFSYTPNANFNGSDYFTYLANDGTGSSSPATVTINVLAVNDAPVAVGDAYMVNEDNVLVDNVVNNDTDPDGPTIDISIVTGPVNGTLTLNLDGSFTYTPSANFNGTDQFKYLYDDGAGGITTENVSITVNAVNDTPQAFDDTYTTTENTSFTVVVPSVLTNDSDPDGDPLAAVLVSGPTNGSLILNQDGSFIYTPNLGYSGADAYTYQAYDGTTYSSTTMVSITITPCSVSGPTASNAAQCGYQIPTASVYSTTGLPNPVFNWYDAASGGTLLQSSTSLTYTSYVSNTTTFYVSELTVSGCESPRTPVSVFVSMPDQVSATAVPNTINLGMSITLSADNANPTPFQLYTYSWQSTVGSGASTPVAGSSVNITPTTAGTYVYTLIATDGGCTAMDTVSVTVIGGIPPVITCPSNINVNTAAGICGAIVNYQAATATGTGNSIVYSHPAGNSFPLGATVVTATATNGIGSDQCTFTVTVQDVTPPMAIAQNISVQLDASGNATITGAMVNNGSSDACGIANLSVLPNSFTCANVGANNVILTVTDVNGNVSTANAVVTVNPIIFTPITVAPLNIAINPGQFVTYTGSTTVGTIRWYNASNLLVATGNTFVTPVLYAGTTYTAKAGVSTCEGPGTVLTVTLKPATTFGGRKAN